METILQQGIAAVKAGDKVRAYELLTRAVQEPAQAEQAWLWLSAVVGHDSERLYCLESTLQINPGNTAAQRGAALLQQKGVIPAVPIGPDTPAHVPSPQIRQASSASAVRPSVTARPGPTPAQPTIDSGAAGSQGSREVIKSLVQELSRKTPRKLLMKNLVDQGYSVEAAESLLKQTEEGLRKFRREKAKKRMLRGFLWTVAGVAVTLGTRLFAEQLGGSFVICYGAIILGVIDLLVGVVTWLAEL